MFGELYFGARNARRQADQFVSIQDFLQTVALLPDSSTAVQYG
jgi:hypothetical protein